MLTANTAENVVASGLPQNTDDLFGTMSLLLYLTTPYRLTNSLSLREGNLASNRCCLLH